MAIRHSYFMCLNGKENAFSYVGYIHFLVPWLQPMASPDSEFWNKGYFRQFISFLGWGMCQSRSSYTLQLSARQTEAYIICASGGIRVDLSVPALQECTCCISCFYTYVFHCNTWFENGSNLCTWQKMYEIQSSSIIWLGTRINSKKSLLLSRSATSQDPKIKY
jgi:hypothetical protein